MSELQAVSTRDDAIARAKRIRAGIRSLAELQQDIIDAYHARDWHVLGYGSWDGYVSGEFGNELPRLDRQERRELVVNLRAEGLSTRAIASVGGVSDYTVREDLRSGARNHAPAVDPAEPDPADVAVTGLDGKHYAPTPSRTPLSSNELDELKPAPQPKPHPGDIEPEAAEVAAQQTALSKWNQFNDALITALSYVNTYTPPADTDIYATVAQAKNRTQRIANTVAGWSNHE